MASIYERLNFSFDTSKFGDSINLSDSTKSYLKAAPVKLETWQKDDLANGSIVKTDYFKNMYFFTFSLFMSCGFIHFKLKITHWYSYNMIVNA